MNILTQSFAITDSMFKFGNFLTKNAITFDQKEIERKKYLVGMKFYCAFNAAIKNGKMYVRMAKMAKKEENNHLFSQDFFNKIALF